MVVHIRLPQALAMDAGGVVELSMEVVDGGTLADLLEELGARHPALTRRLCDETGRIRRFVNIYLDADESRGLRGLATPLHEGVRILVVGSVAGG